MRARGFFSLITALVVATSLLPESVQAACTTATLSAGQTVNGTLASSDCVDNNINGLTYYYDYYEFNGVAGQQISLLNTSSTIDVDLTLIFPDGSYLYDDDSGGGTSARIPASGTLSLPTSGTYHIAASSSRALQTGAYTLTLSSASITPPTSRSQAIEFYNSVLDHYFLTSDSNEAAGIDAGAAGAGWSRTGTTFNTGGPTAVCRFYGSVTPGPNSHFYTASQDECDLLKQIQTSTPATQKRWNFEGLDFYTTAPTSGVCESGTVPIYRAYNNGFARGIDSNHRITRSLSGVQDVVDRGWIGEGVVLCAQPGSNKGITGGTFVSANGAASVTVNQGTIPSYANVSAPTLTAVTKLPSNLFIDIANGDLNVTAGGLGYTFDLTGDLGFFTNSAGAIKISLPFNSAAIAAADLASSLKVFVRIYNPLDGSSVDLNGDITISGGVYKVTVETRGLANQFTAVVIYNPNMEATFAAEDTLGLAPGWTLLEDASSTPSLVPSSHAGVRFGVAARAAASWPSRLWCVTYNPNNPTLIDAVKSIRGITTVPTRDEIRNTVSFKSGARKAQLVYERDGFLAPDLYIGTKSCGGTTPYYTIHLSATKSSAFTGNSSDEEVISPEGNHYGRVYINYMHLPIMGHVVAHEVHHAIQSSYDLKGDMGRGLREGTATIYGSTIYNGGAITVRSEVQRLNYVLLTPDLIANANPPGGFRAGYYAYGNEDFFAYVGRQYNGGSLAYLAGLYDKIRADNGASVYYPSLTELRTSMDSYFRTAFSVSLKDLYLDFVQQRALTHNAASQLGHTGDVVSGFAANLFGAGFRDIRLPLPGCNVKLNGTIWNVGPFSSSFVRITPVGTLPSGDGPKVTLKAKPSFSSIGGSWSGFSARGNAVGAVAATSVYTNFGKTAGDQIVEVFVNTDFAQGGSLNYELSCETLQITGVSPVRGPPDSTITITGTAFGTSADTRAVYFNGVAATNVTWSSDTQAIAKVPPNASTGDVVVEVNGAKSNGVNFELVAQCSATQNAGNDTPDTRTVELGKRSGTFLFAYNTYTQKDQILVKYQGTTLFDTGCVGTASSKSISYNGNSTQITVQVLPNCAGGKGTAWDYSVGCP